MIPGQNMLAKETDIFPHQKRVVWQGRLQLKSKPQPPQLWETRVAVVAGV